MNLLWLPVITISGLGFMVGCTPVQPPLTPSGKPEVTFQNVDPSCIRNAIIDKSLNEGWQPKNVNEWQIVLERPTRNVMASALLSSRMYTEVLERLTITTSRPSPDSLRLVLSGAYVTNPGSGFEKLTEIQGTASDQEKLAGLDERGNAACAKGVTSTSNTSGNAVPTGRGSRQR